MGRRHTEETKRRISEVLKGRVVSEETRAKLRESHKGQVSWRKGKQFVSKEEQRKRRRAYKKAWESRNQCKVQASRVRCYKKNRARILLKKREEYQSRREESLGRIRAAKYGISPEEFAERVAKQNGRCEICGCQPHINLSVDHDHTTEAIRGLICNACNIAIAKAGDSPDRLRSMADYLERYGKRY